VELRERRQAARGADDPVVTAIVRTAALDTARTAVRTVHGELRRDDADPSTAAELLSGLSAGALRNFDPFTASATTDLGAQLAAGQAFASRSPELGR
jgi:hypothetical protein